jgi:hypothetical protein
MEGPAALRKQVKDKIDALTATEHEEVLRILMQHGIGFSRNSNGLFVDLAAVPDVVVGKIHDFVRFCVQNTPTLEAYDHRLLQCKMNNDMTPLAGAVQSAPASASPVEDRTATDGWQDALPKDKRLTDLVACIRHDKTRVLGEGGGRSVGHGFNVAKKRYCRPSPCACPPISASALLHKDPYSYAV